MFPAPVVHTHAYAHARSIAHTTKRDLSSCVKLQKAVMREEDGNRVNRSEAAGTIGIEHGENIFSIGRKGADGMTSIHVSP